MDITQSEKTIPVYTVGGQDFVNRQDAERHLAQLTDRLRYAYYLVRTGYDRAEGRGYFHERVVGIRMSEHNGYESGAILSYCFLVFGDSVDDFYGRPISRWVTGDAHTFEEPDDLDNWIEGARARARQHRIRFDGPVLCDGFGVQHP